MNADVQFFFDHAGYSWNPATETEQAGRLRCAENLAAAEGIARAAGVSFDWTIDPDIDSSDFSDDPEPWALWQCVAYDAAGSECGCLCGVDFGRDGSPHADDYRRVVEAEIAAEYVDATLKAA